MLALASPGPLTARPWAAALPATVVAASWVDLPRVGYGAGRPGFYWASLVFVATTLWLALRYEGLMPASLARRALDNERVRQVLWAGTAVAFSWSVTVLWANARGPATLEAGRVGACLVFFAFTRHLAQRDPRVRSYLAACGLSFVVLQVCILVAGHLLAPLFQVVFERAPHAFVGYRPRFRSWMPQPMACGSAVLPAMALAACSDRRLIRVTALLAGSLVVIATFSFAALTLPLAAWTYLSRSWPKRRAMAALLVLLPALFLWIKVTELRLGESLIFSQPPPPSYFADGRGPTAMPVHHLDLAGFGLSFHLSAYALLGIRAVTCLSEHPLGVGGRNFEKDCPVLAMNTVGAWDRHRGPHNLYGSLLAEGGPLVVLATLAFVAALARAFVLPPNLRLATGLLFATLLSGWGGASCFQYSVAALAGVLLQPRFGYSRHVALPLSTDDVTNA